MPKKLITEQQIIKAAQIIVANNINPTLIAVRKQLNYCGSDSTIHKYLSQWKMACFKNMLQRENQEERVKPTALEANALAHSLKLELRKQMQLNEEYTQELIQAEKAVVALKEENQQLQKANHKLQLELQEVTAIKTTLTQVNQEIQSRLDLNESNSITQKQQLIESLQFELKELNAKSMKTMQELSSYGHEVLMQEKVYSINLQTKVDNLYKELMDSKKQLNDAALKYQAQTQVLLRQINWQQKIIEEHVGDEKLRALVGEPELMLNFNNKGAAYAK